MLFAVDMSCIIKDKVSYSNLFCILESFGDCSGSKVNDEKTEILALGNNVKWHRIPSLGGYDYATFDLNFLLCHFDGKIKIKNFVYIC